MNRGHNYSRRDLLKGAGAVAAVAITTRTLGGPGLATAAGPLAGDETADVVIVGTGYAGSIAAYRLAQRGIRSTVLERGRRWPITRAGDTFATPDAPDGRAAWLSTTSPFTPEPLPIFPGVLESFFGDGVIALAGAGVGGGSLVNTTGMLKPSEALFRASFGSTVDYREMDSTWFPRALSLIGASPLPRDVLASDFYLAARSFQEEAVRAGFQPELFDLAVNWDIVRQEMAGARRPSIILGHALWGVNSGAKRSVDRTILAAAERTGRVQVQTLSEVVEVAEAAGGYELTILQRDGDGNEIGRRRLRAPLVILAAGSLGTNRLLVRARETGSLPALSPEIGEGWGANGDNLNFRRGMPYNNPTQGGPSGVAVYDWEDNPVAPTTLFNFPNGAEPPDGGGEIATLGLSVVPGIGRMFYDAASDSVQLHWPSTDPRITVATDAVRATLDRLNAANPGTFTQEIASRFTAHPLGGVQIGRDCDSIGMLHGYRNLFVMDGSLVPGSCGAMSPALTISALADRCVTGLIARQRSQSAQSVVAAA